MVLFGDLIQFLLELGVSLYQACAVPVAIASETVLVLTQSPVKELVLIQVSGVLARQVKDLGGLRIVLNLQGLLLFGYVHILFCTCQPSIVVGSISLILDLLLLLIVLLIVSRGGHERLLSAFPQH